MKAKLLCTFMSLVGIAQASTLTIYNDMKNPIFVKLVCARPSVGDGQHCSNNNAYFKIEPNGKMSFEGNNFSAIQWMNLSSNTVYEIKKDKPFQLAVLPGGGHFAILENGIDYTYAKGLRLETGRADQELNGLGKAISRGKAYQVK